jgi:pteridine reductase
MTHPDANAARESGRALVTGGGVRVGRAVAVGLAAAGWDVAVHHHTSVEEAGETAARIRSAGREAATVRADLSRPEEIPGMVRRAAGELGGLDLLVNNAAVFPRAAPSEVTPEHWDRVFAVNARAPFFCAREAAEVMGDAGGCIVNVADVAAFEAWPAYAPYAATKAALVSLTRSLAAAWAPRVRVNAVAPGPVLLPEGASAAERRRARRSTLLGRVGEARDVAEAVLYLAGAGFVTGEVLRVDGGEHVARTTRE